MYGTTKIMSSYDERQTQLTQLKKVNSFQKHMFKQF